MLILDPSSQGIKVFKHPVFSYRELAIWISSQILPLRHRFDSRGPDALFLVSPSSTEPPQWTVSSFLYAHPGSWRLSLLAASEAGCEPSIVCESAKSFALEVKPETRLFGCAGKFLPYTESFFFHFILWGFLIACLSSSTTHFEAPGTGKAKSLSF